MDQIGCRRDHDLISLKMAGIAISQPSKSSYITCRLTILYYCAMKRMKMCLSRCNDDNRCSNRRIWLLIDLTSGSGSCGPLRICATMPERWQACMNYLFVTRSHMARRKNTIFHVSPTGRFATLIRCNSADLACIYQHSGRQRSSCVDNK